VISLYYYALIVKKMFLESFSFESEFKLSFLEALLLIICAIPVVFLGIFWGRTSLFLERALNMF
jgi:NADH:ubiquinone oxidoreductase subunit 2 (subunit N)